MSLDECKLIHLPKVEDLRGNLTFLESFNQIQFEIKRVYYLYDIPCGSIRGGHAHKKLKQLIIPLAGSFDVVLNDGEKQDKFHMNSPSKGLYICPMIWRELNNFSSGSVCLVLASNFYTEDDYYREYSVYKKKLKKS